MFNVLLPPFPSSFHNKLAPPYAQSAWGFRRGKGLSYGISSMLYLFLKKKQFPYLLRSCDLEDFKKCNKASNSIHLQSII